MNMISDISKFVENNYFYNIIANACTLEKNCQSFWETITASWRVQGYFTTQIIML